MATYALVHGAWHGAWCWERLTPELEAMGHHTVAVDLPIDDPSASFDDYADVVCAAISDQPGDDLIVVGHSLGGLTVSLVAARRQISHLVYLCALLPIPGQPFLFQLRGDREMTNPDYPKGLGPKDSLGRRAWVDDDLATFHLFDDCDNVLRTAAIARLRPQADYPYGLPCSLNKFPEVSSSYVVCAEDRMVNPDWSRRTARDRFGADVIEMPGSHSPFLSRPRALAGILDALA
jgi:pimeloyl-ACP methyl ester carboxylesterase